MDKSAICGSYIKIQGEEFVHLVKVLRHKVGYSLIVCEGSGKDYLCKIIAIDKDSALCEITDIIDNESEASLNVTMYLGVIKNEKMTFAIQKAVELGANSIVLFESKYSTERNVNIERYQKVAKEAAKQCGRAIMPEVIGLVSFEEVLNTQATTKLMAYEKENVTKLSNIVSSASKDISIIIGSEGGFTEGEVNAAKDSGFVTFSLGRRIMRAETAAIVTLGCLMQILDN